VEYLIEQVEQHGLEAAIAERRAEAEAAPAPESDAEPVAVPS
jgi:hypothetical protein